MFALADDDLRDILGSAEPFPDKAHHGIGGSRNVRSFNVRSFNDFLIRLFLNLIPPLKRLRARRQHDPFAIRVTYVIIDS